MLQSSVVRTSICNRKLDDTNVTGKYFEVRYFLNVVVSSAHTLVYGQSTWSAYPLSSYRRLVTVQLPIVLIHMVSPADQSL